MKYFKFNTNIIQKIKDFLHRCKIIKILLDLLCKLMYIFKKDFLYADVFDFVLKIMVVNQGSKDTDKFLNIGKQLNLFFLFIIIRFGEWYYSKETKDENKIVEIDPPKNINKLVEKNNCPICKKSEIESPVAMRCCGYVLCEICVGSNKTSGKCLVCLNKINSNYYIKIYM
jgi:hypothetical protein